MFKLNTNSPEETFSLGERLAEFLFPGSVMALFGELGAGKTLFAQGVAKGLNVDTQVTSPTFTIINEHRGRMPFFHIDAYRLEKEAEVAELGLEEYFYADGVTLIEWPERIKGSLPSSYLQITLKKASPTDHTRRQFIFNPMGQDWKIVMGEFKASENIRN